MLEQLGKPACGFTELQREGASSSCVNSRTDSGEEEVPGMISQGTMCGVDGSLTSACGLNLNTDRTLSASKTGDYQFKTLFVT